MDHLLEALEVVYALSIGSTIAFVSGATVERIGPDAHRVTDTHGKVYSNLSSDHAAMIANKGE